jgi:magnesium-protoporphyrin O-methyltransferase
MPETTPPYAQTRARVETYFDKSATQVWERLTSDAPVSRIRQTVRAGRDKMRALMLAQLPQDLTGARVLDAGCGAGQMTAELAARGALVIAVDISPQLLGIAARRLPSQYAEQVRFVAGDMTNPDLGPFDYAMAMDSLIYYTAPDIAAVLAKMAGIGGAQKVVFTVAPASPLLTLAWNAGRLFPRADRAPTMQPHRFSALQAACGGRLSRIDRISAGFYTSDCLEYRP